MVRHLFPRFLASEDEYRAAAWFWRDLFTKVATDQGQSGEWFPWQLRTFANGTQIPSDGNPIFEARSEKLGRAVRIIQSPPEATSVEIAAWVDTFDFSEAGGPGFTEELVINLSLSEESAHLSARLIEQWMDRSVSRERMEDLVKDLRSGPA
jgi:hypothetical protein